MLRSTLQSLDLEGGRSSNVTPVSVALRVPANLVSSRAVAYWRVQGAGLVIAGVLVAAAVVVAATVALPAGWWTPLLWVAAVLCVLVPLPWLVLLPQLSYKVYRWEVTDIAVHVRYGKLSRTEELVPLSRVQIVDSFQDPVMRYFDLRTVTLRTASKEGKVAIKCLDEALAHEVIARLVEITAAIPEDAT